MKSHLFIIVALLTLFLCGCNRASVMKLMEPQEDQNVAQYYINLLRAHDLGPIERDVDPTLKNTGLHPSLVQAANQIPPEEPVSMKLVGFDINYLNKTRRTNTVYEYEFSKGWLLINVATQKQGNVFTLIGLRVIPLADSLEDLNKFTLRGKGLGQYVVLLSGILEVLLILYSLVVCLRSPVLKRRWLWILFILFGLGEFSVNWTTGQLAVNPLSFQLFGFSGFTDGYGPWIIKVSVPLGAYVFLLLRRRLEDHSPLNTDLQSPGS
jgi:hypothetical protein